MTPGDDGAGDVEQGEIVGRLLGPADAEIAGGLRLHCGYLDVRAVLADVGLASQLERTRSFASRAGSTRACLEWRSIGFHPEDDSNPQGAIPLSCDDEGRVLIPSYWLLRKDPNKIVPNWDAVRRWALARRYGERISWLRIGRAGSRRDDGTIARISGQKGHVFYRPYHSVPTGPHRILLMIKENYSHNRKARGSILESVVNIVLIANRSFDRASLRSGASISIPSTQTIVLTRYWR